MRSVWRTPISPWISGLLLASFNGFAIVDQFIALAAEASQFADGKCLLRIVHIPLLQLYPRGPIQETCHGGIVEVVARIVVMLGVPQDNTAINSLEDLAGTHVLTITGTATAIFLEKYNEEHPDGQIILDYIDAGAQECISQVVTGRYDACIQNKADFAIAQEEHGYELRLIEIENSNEISLPDGYFLFAKDEAELQKAVDECLKEMKADGTLTELCLRYFTMDLVPQE